MPDLPAFSLPVITFPGSGADAVAFTLPSFPELPAEVGVEIVIPPVILAPQTALEPPVFTVEVVTAWCPRLRS